MLNFGCFSSLRGAKRRSNLDFRAFEIAAAAEYGLAMTQKRNLYSLNGYKSKKLKGKSASKRRDACAEGTDANARQALDALCLVESHLPRGQIGDIQSPGRAIGNAVAAVRTASLVQCYSLAGIVDGDVKGFYEVHAPLDIVFGSGNIQHEIAFLLRSNLRSKHVDDEVVVFDQMVDDGLFAFAFWKEQHQFLCYGLAHDALSLIRSGFILVSFGRYAIGSARRKSPFLISSASRLAISNAI